MQRCVKTISKLRKIFLKTLSPQFHETAAIPQKINLFCSRANLSFSRSTPEDPAPAPSRTILRRSMLCRNQYQPQNIAHSSSRPTLQPEVCAPTIDAAAEANLVSGAWYRNLENREALRAKQPCWQSISEGRPLLKVRSVIDLRSRRSHLLQRSAQGRHCACDRLASSRRIQFAKVMRILPL